MKLNFEKILLGLSFVSMVVLGFGAYFTYGFIENNNKLAEEAHTKWFNTENSKREIDLLDKTLQAVKDDIAKLNSHFVYKSDVVPFLDFVEYLGGQVGAKVEISTVDASLSGDSLVVGVNASGSFASVYKLLTLLETSPYEIEMIYSSMEEPKAASSATSYVGGGEWQGVFNIRLLSFINK